MSNPKHSLIQDDIEIEVAEALFDLMKQSQSQSQSSQRQEKVDRDSVNTASDGKFLIFDSDLLIRVCEQLEFEKASFVNCGFGGLQS